jgi:hypothetical protein
MQITLLCTLYCSLKLTRCSSKARHVKCDEARPSCHRCIASQGVREGYSDDRNYPRDRSALVHIAPRRLGPTDVPIRTMTNIHVCLSSVECQAFDYFRLDTIKQLPGGSLDLLWERLALYMSANEPAVAHAVVALASLHPSFECWVPLARHSISSPCITVTRQCQVCVASSQLFQLQPIQIPTSRSCLF